MTTRLYQSPRHHHLLLDPPRLEEAGRAFRKWIDRLRGHPRKDEDLLTWETGEPRDEERDPPRLN